MKTITIVGGGSWGTALAIILASRFDHIRLWVYEPELAQRMQRTRENDIYLPGLQIPANIVIENDLAAAVEAADVVVSVMPSHLIRGIYEKLALFLKKPVCCVSATKGLENDTLLRPSEIIRQVLDAAGLEPRIAVISGPSFAREVARFEPTALVVASADRRLAETVQAAFSSVTFRLYRSSDPIGVEVGGSIKNVVAIGAGVLHGMGMGHNALAALITRGLAEMTRLAVALGGKAQTLAGLAGLGDLVLTCTGDLSRNRSVGIALAHGRKLDEIVGSMKMVAEGIKTTNAAVDLARRHAVEMPISEQMFQMLHFGISPREAIRRLMERSLRGE